MTVVCEVGLGMSGRMGDIFAWQGRVLGVCRCFVAGASGRFLAGGCRLNSSFRNVANKPACLLFSSNIKKNIKTSLFKVK